MENKRETRRNIYGSDIDLNRLAEDFTWGTNAEVKQDAMAVYLIHAIANRHHGKATVDFANHFVDIDVPAEKKAACLREIEEKTGITLQ